MSIPVECACGRTLHLRSELAGKRVKCPNCGGVLNVPAPESDPEDDAANMLLEDDGDSSPPPREQQVTARPPLPSAPIGPPASRPSYAQPLGDPFDRASRPAKPVAVAKKPARERRSGVSFEEGWFGSLNAGMIGGMLMMLIALVWFFGALAVGIIFFYPPILFVIGIVAFLRGLFNRS